MQYVQKAIHLSLSVVASVFKEDALVAIDTTPTIYNFSHDGEFLSHNSIGGFDSFAYRYTKSIALSNDGHYTLLCNAQNSKALLIDLTTKKLLLQIKMEKSPKFALFSPDMLYCIVANAVGRVMLYNITTLELYDEFAFPDELANASFTPDGAKLMVTTLNKALYIYDIASKKIETKQELKEIAELLFIANDASDILLFTRTGETLRYNVTTAQLFNADPSYEWATTLTHSSNKRVVLVGTRSSQLFLYSANKGNILGTLSFEFWGISSLCCTNRELFIGFSDGNGILLDLSEQIQQAKEMLEAKEIEKLSLSIVESPLVFLDAEFCDLIVSNYEQILEYKPLGSQERAGYDAIVSLLLSDERYNAILLKQLYGSDEIISFTQELEVGRVKEACELAYSAPLLRQLKEYSKLRTNCYVQISKEIKILERNPHEFNEYLDSKSHSCLQCEHGVVTLSGGIVEAYKKLCSAAEAMSYASVLEIVSQYPLFRQTKVFARMMHYGESLIDKTLIMLGANKIEEALKYATKLSLIKPFAKTGDDFKKQIALYVSFKKACDTQNITQICSIVKGSPALKTTELFKKQVTLYNEHAKPAFAMAHAGDVNGVLKHMSKYLALEHFIAKNNELKRLALLYEIKNYAPDGEERELLAKYYQCFGWDEHYESVCNFFQIEVQKELKDEDIDPQCYEKSSFLEGERIKRKDHFQNAGEKK